MYKLFIIVVICSFLKGIDNLIVPDEVPSLLSLIYSNIPPIRKGTDSRLGWGFRLGDHADFQVLLELGPQTNTRPLGNEGEKNNKRNTQNNLRNTLWAQSQLIKQQTQAREQDKISDTEGGKWLENWRQQMNKQNTEKNMEIVESLGAGEVDASKVIPAELEDLYGNRRSINIQKIAPNVGKFSPTPENVPTTLKSTKNEGEGSTFLAKLARG